MSELEVFGALCKWEYFGNDVKAKLHPHSLDSSLTGALYLSTSY